MWIYKGKNSAWHSVLEHECRKEEVTEVKKVKKKSNTNSQKMSKNKDLLIVLLAVSVFVYLVLVKGYVTRQICNVRGSFFLLTITYVGIVTLFLIRMIRRGEKQICLKNWCKWTCLFCNPIIFFILEEIQWNPQLKALAGRYIVMNYLVLLLIEIIFVLLFQRTVIGYGVLALCFWFYGIANCYFVQYKGNPILPQDITSLNTAVGVLREYEYPLSDSIVIGTVILLFFLLFLMYFDVQIVQLSKKSKWITKSIGIVVGIGLIFCVNYVSFGQHFGISVSAWSPYESFEVQGAPISFCCLIQEMHIKQPDGYSTKKMKRKLAQYEYGQSEKFLQKKPSVVVIMNESLADLSVLGEFESEEYLSGIKNLTGCLQKGYVYTSAYGGATCNSEFEFLTGNSMANLGTPIYPYSSLNLKKTFNLVEEFESLGYETIAFHPYTRTNWNRDKVYKTLGFDSFIADDDLQGMEVLSWCASDRYDYEVLIDLFEQKKAPLFLFNVTMQNHGGYYVDFSNKVPLIQVSDELQGYIDVKNYLTLVRESDKAFVELLNYFSKQDEPIIVCLFGDHQPALDEGFVATVLGDRDTVEKMEKLYKTPYVIWSNYLTDVDCMTQDMSLNYLGANLLSHVGVKCDYTEYLLDLYREIPIINMAGYQTKDMVWHNWAEENEHIKLYRQMQYYQLFKREG